MASPWGFWSPEGSGAAVAAGVAASCSGVAQGDGDKEPGHRQGQCPCVRGSGSCSRTCHGPSCSKIALRSPSRREGEALGEPRLSEHPHISGSNGTAGDRPSAVPRGRPLGWERQEPLLTAAAALLSPYTIYLYAY